MRDTVEDERRQMDPQAGRGDEHLRLIADSLPVLVSYIGADLRYRFVNRAYEDWFGHPGDSLRGKTMEEVLGAETFATIRGSVTAALAGNEVTYEATVSHRTGGLRDIRATYVPHAVAGRVEGFVALVADITRERQGSRERDELVTREHEARTRAEAALARVGRLQQLTAALSETADLEEIYALAVSQGMAATGAQAASLALVRAAQREIEVVANRGYPAELIETWQRFPLDATTPLARAISTRTAVFCGSRVEIGERYPNLPSSSGYEAVAAVPLLVHGRAIGALGLSFASACQFTPDEEQHLVAIARQCAMAIARSQLFEAERRAHTEAEAARGRLLVLADASAAFARAALDTDALVKIIARKVSETPGECCSVRLIAEDSDLLEHVTFHHRDPETEARVRHLFSDRPVRVGEGLTGRVAQSGLSVRIPEVNFAQLRTTILPEYRHLLDASPPRSLMVIPLKTRDRVLGVLGLARFQGAGPYSEEDQRLVEDLADRAAMGVEISRLFAKERRAVRARDDFLSIAGHELRTPLTALQLQVQSLLHSKRIPMDPKVHERVAKMEQHTARVTRLVEELLDVGRISGGRLQFTIEPVDLAALIAEVADRFREAMVRARCVLTVHVESEAPIIGAWDRTRLDQVLTNLIDNARKYGAGNPVNLRARRVADRARIEVEDRGIGIPAADQDRIFGRFERAVSQRNYGGLGIGLWISRQMIDAMGGTISFQSVQGDGSTFVVELPLGQLTGEIPRPAIRGNDRAASERARHGGT